MTEDPKFYYELSNLIGEFEPNPLIEGETRELHSAGELPPTQSENINSKTRETRPNKTKRPRQPIESRVPKSETSKGFIDMNTSEGVQESAENNELIPLYPYEDDTLMLASTSSSSGEDPIQNGAQSFNRPLTRKALERITPDVNRRRSAIGRIRKALPYAGDEQLSRIMR